MKAFKTIAKILTAIAAVVGAVYIAATYGDKIVAWAKKTLNNWGLTWECTCDCDGDCEDCECEGDCEDCECACECDCICEEAPAEEAEVEAEEADFEG